MPRKGKGRKIKKNLDPLVEAKIKEINKLKDAFHVQADQYEAYLNTKCSELCQKIYKMYMDRLNVIPEDMRNMTISEILEKEKQVTETTVQDDFLSYGQSQYEKTKLLSEKKKTLKMARLERKRSLSASVVKDDKISSMVQSSNRFSRMRIFSESCLNTPLGKRSVLTSRVVTPKFNPEVPLNNALLRKPKAGEILMSLSGSPLQNYSDCIPDKPGVTVSLGGGKIIKITEDTEIAKLESEFIHTLNYETKATLENVKKKLDRILLS